MRWRTVFSTLVFDIVLVAAIGVALTYFIHTVYARSRSISFEMGAPPGLLPAAGLYDIETFPDKSGRYRWTNGNGVVRLPNPGGGVIVQFALAAGLDRTLPITISTDSTSLHLLVTPPVRQYIVALPPSAGDRIPVHIVSPGLVEQERVIGVLLSTISMHGGGSIPLRILVALWLGTIGFYSLLRCAGTQAVYAAGFVLLVFALLLVWQRYEGWLYGLTSTCLFGLGLASLLAVAAERWLPRKSRSTAPVRAIQLYDWYTLIVVLVITLLTCIPLLAMSDPVGDLELSARQMNLLFYQGLAGAYRFGNDYMPLRLYMLRGLGILAPFVGAGLGDPLPTATLILLKLPGLIANLATVGVIYVWSRRWCTSRAAAGIALLYALAPPVWINVAWWGQVDAWLMLPLLSSVLLLEYGSGQWSWVCWGVALLLKPQAIIVLPVLYAVTVWRYGSRGFLVGALLGGVTLLLGCLPVVWAQRSVGGIVQAYVGSVERFPLLTNRAFNLWYLVTGGNNSFDVGQGLGPISYRLIGLALTAITALFVTAGMYKRNDTAARLYGAALLALAFFLLPTQIHERYLFLALAFLALNIANDRHLLVPYLILVVTGTLNILGTLGGFVPWLYRLIASSPLPLYAAAVNLIVFAYVLYRFASLLREQPTTAVIDTHDQT